MLLGDNKVGWSSGSSCGGSLAFVVVLVLELVGVGRLWRIRRDKSINTGLLPGTVSVLIESSTAFLGTTGDDGGDLASWLGLD